MTRTNACTASARPPSRALLNRRDRVRDCAPSIPANPRRTRLTLTADSRIDLGRPGWDEVWTAAMATHAAAGFVPGRIAAQFRGAHTVLTAAGVASAELAG